MNTHYDSKAEYINEVILPALGDYADDYDTEAIADDMLTWTEVEDEITGLINDNKTGFTENDIDFWEVAAAHEITAA